MKPWLALAILVILQISPALQWFYPMPVPGFHDCTPLLPCTSSDNSDSSSQTTNPDSSDSSQTGQDTTIPSDASDSSNNNQQGPSGETSTSTTDDTSNGEQNPEPGFLGPNQTGKSARLSNYSVLVIGGVLLLLLV